MINTLKVLKNSTYILCGLFFLNSCSSPEGNETANEKSAHTTDTVVIKQMQFTPAELSVQKGDTIVWINNDLVAHDITEEKNKAFYSDTLEVGKSWKWVVTDSAAYMCSIHPSMKGKIVLK
jgi:plastocyanin